MSRSLARASEHTVEPLIAWAIACTASKSPFDDAAKPASMTSTLSRSSWRAMRSFSSLVIEAPGDCSPSRKVVSKMNRRSVTAISFAENKTARCVCKRAGQTRRWDEVVQRALKGRRRSRRAERIRDITEVNIAQRASAVQALFVGLVGRCCNHAHRLALHLLPDVHRRNPTRRRRRTGRTARPATWMLMMAMPRAIRTMTTNGTERLMLRSLKL